MDLVKIELSPRREHDFLGFEESKFNKIRTKFEQKKTRQNNMGKTLEKSKFEGQNPPKIH